MILFKVAKKHKKSFAVLQLLFALAVCVPLDLYSQATQQNSDDIEIINLDSIYQNNVPARKSEIKKQVTQPPVTAAPLETPATTEDFVDETVVPEDVKVEELKDLSLLSPFSEVSVIQKKLMPKSGRFQAFGGLGLTTNTPWFFNAGFKLNLGYHFTENFGLELSTLFLSSTEREVAKEIRANNNLQPEQFIYTKSYIGADLLWTPIYGKITFLNQKIIPYEMYFSGGGGTSNTNSVEKNVPTFHFGTGQIFTITKSMAFRWDYSLNIFQATALTSNAIVPEKGSYNDLIFSAGVSFFFPEAKSR
jgi:outer membrane beta-barrel protein